MIYKKSGIKEMTKKLKNMTNRIKVYKMPAKIALLKIKFENTIRREKHHNRIKHRVTDSSAKEQEKHT